MPSKPRTPDEGAHEALPPGTRVRVLIAGISRPGLAPAYQGEIVLVESLGDAAKAQRLLDLKRIEVVDDDATL